MTMGIFGKRWLVTDDCGDTLMIVARGKSMELRRAGIGGAVEFFYEDPHAEFAEGWGNKDFYVRGGQRKRVMRARLYDLSKGGGARIVEFRNMADGKSFRRWIERIAK